jgi:hypothetical protein
MSDEYSESMRMELFAASIRAGKADINTFLDALAIKLEGSLPEYTKIIRQGSIFSREHSVKEIVVSLGEYQYRIGREKQGPLGTKRSHTVQGIILKTEQIPVDVWIDELSQSLAQLASRSAQSRASLERFLIK